MREVYFFLNAGGVLSWVADEDLTIRQAMVASGCISVDPSLDGSPLSADGVSTELRLDDNFVHWYDLAFPVPKGTPIFYATTAGGSAVILLEQSAQLA
jgi:hypothetical protein